MKNLLLNLFLFASFYSCAQQNKLAKSAIAVNTQLTDAQKVTLIDEYIEQARKDWEVPGLAISIIKDGKVIHSKGYGIRSLDKAEAVNTQTLFGSMSTTKAMVAVGMALLVDEGKVNWDDKVIKHLPAFKIGDAYITKELTIRDLFTHNAGLGNADFLWAWTPDMSSDKILKRMQYAKPAYSFRGGYTYQNIMYLAAGKVIEKITGQSWEQFTENRIFLPLGMTNSFANLKRSLHYANRSLAHYKINGKIEVIEETSADPVAPAGAVWSTAEDISQWVKFLLNNKTVNGKPLVKPATLAECFKAQVIIPRNQFYPTTALTKPNWTTYGLAWFQHDYRGEMLNFHTGSLAGRTAIIGLLRDKNIGVYIFGNLDHAEVRHALMYKVFDLFAFDDNSRDWSAETQELYKGLAQKGNKNRAEQKAKRVANTKASHPLMAYEGTYTDKFYGTVEVIQKDKQLILKISNKFYATLEHWHYDTFQATWNNAWWGTNLISFELDAVSGAVKAISFSGSKWTKE